MGPAAFPLPSPSVREQTQRGFAAADPFHEQSVGLMQALGARAGSREPLHPTRGTARLGTANPSTPFSSVTAAIPAVLALLLLILPVARKPGVGGGSVLWSCMVLEAVPSVRSRLVTGIPGASSMSQQCLEHFPSICSRSTVEGSEGKDPAKITTQPCRRGRCKLRGIHTNLPSAACASPLPSVLRGNFSPHARSKPR